MCAVDTTGPGRRPGARRWSDPGSGAAEPYDVVIGRGVLGDIGAWVPPTGARRAALVAAPTVAGSHAARVAAGLRAAGFEVHGTSVPDGEASKSLDVLGGLYDWLASIPLGRGDMVVAVGGGVITDLAGFAAATWHRGVAVVQVPTTLLAQVDAAIGGKTGVNLAAGKNLVGAFHQPVVVVVDVDVLDTLPTRELRAGLAEIIKCGFIRDAAILGLVEDDPEAALDPRGEVLVDLVRRAATVKAAVVGADSYEHGVRALLNYGHTFGHALEALTGYTRYRHGEAVGIGMRYAARVGELAGVSVAGLERRTSGVLQRLGLPTDCPPLEAAAVFAAMARDKKARNGLRLVLCERPGHARVVDAPPRPLLEQALADVYEA
jgi:3-dehydroquinate synthase